LREGVDRDEGIMEASKAFRGTSFQVHKDEFILELEVPRGDLGFNKVGVTVPDNFLSATLGPLRIGLSEGLEVPRGRQRQREAGAPVRKESGIRWIPRGYTHGG
jgi:hypothetical protein